MLMALSKLPAVFNLEAKEKGYFPHFFNTLENSNYVGPYPPMETYGVESMTAKDRSKFESWYRAQDGKVFNMREQIVAYCSNDVDLLRMACLQYRKLFLDVTGIDPLRECLTIASLCMKVYRRNHLKENLIALLPRGGYRNLDTQSRTAIEWLEFESFRTGLHIAHAKNGREKRIGS